MSPILSDRPPASRTGVQPESPPARMEAMTLVGRRAAVIVLGADAANADMRGLEMAVLRNSPATAAPRRRRLPARWQTLLERT